jgi:hypothetical protein
METQLISPTGLQPADMGTPPITQTVAPLIRMEIAPISLMGLQLAPTEIAHITRTECPRAPTEDADRPD